MITTFHLPTKIIFGSGSLAQLGVEARRLGQKAILVTGLSSMRRSGVLDKVINDLKANGIATIIYDKVEPNPRASTVDEAARIVRSKGIDIVIGLGGGSAMDAAKGIVLASTGTKSIIDYFDAEIDEKAPTASLILVPTVAGSGTEANDGAVITDWETGEKWEFFSPYFLPKVSIVDPELTLTLPKKPTAQGGVDIFCHLVETYLVTQRPPPLADGILEMPMRLVVESLPQALSRLDDIEARTRLSWASTVACSQFTQLGAGAGTMTLHGIEHPLSGYYDIAHGDGLAALLPAWMRYTFPVRQEKFYSLGKNVFGEMDGILATEEWLEKIGMRLRLRDLGIKPERFEQMADCALRTVSWLKLHPRLLDAAAIVKIYQDSY